MVDEATYNAADRVQGAPRPLECAKRGQPHEMWMDDLVHRALASI